MRVSRFKYTIFKCVVKEFSTPNAILSVEVYTITHAEQELLIAASLRSSHLTNILSTFEIEDIKEAINPKTKSIFLIDPINPLGSTYPKEEKKAICDLAEDHDFWIIDDITYRDFAPNHVLAADILPEKTITGYSVSKNCGLAG